MSFSRYRIGFGFNRTLKSQGSLPWRKGNRPSQHLLVQDWILTTDWYNPDYFAKYQYDSSLGKWRVRDGVWVVDERPPVFWVFHPLNAALFKFDLYASNSSWAKGSLVASSGWQKSAIWYLEPDVSLTETHYLLEVQYRSWNYRYRLVGDDAIRVYIPPDAPTVDRIKAVPLRNIFETYPSQTIDGNMVRRSVLGRHLSAIREKYNQAAADPAAYPITYYVVGRQLGSEMWSGNTFHFSKAKIQALCERQIALETAFDTNDTSYTDPSVDDPHIYIFDMRGEQNNNRSVVYRDGYFGGFILASQYLNFLLAIAVLHPSTTERQAAYNMFRIFARTLIERVWTNNRGKTLTNHPIFSHPSRAAFAIASLAVFYDLLYSEFIESDTFTIRLFDEDMPIKKAIPVFLKSFLEQRYFTSNLYLFFRNNSPAGINPEEVGLLRQFSSHRHRVHLTYFLVMLLLNQLLGWDNWTELVQRELNRLYGTMMPWSLNDFGYNEGCGYLLAYMGYSMEYMPLIQAAGVPCHQIRRVDRCAWDLIYAGPYGTQEWSPGDSNFVRHPFYDRYNWAILQTFVIGSRFNVGTFAKPGTPEAQIFRSYATAYNFQGCALPQETYAGHLPNIWLPIFLTPTVNEMIEAPAPTEPLTSAPDFLISKVTKFAFVPTDFRTDQREDTLSGKPKINVRFYGRRLRRASHMRNTVNDIQIVAGGEHLLGMSLYGYGSGTGFLQSWAISSLSYTTPLVMPQGSVFSQPFVGTNQWYWETTYGSVPIRNNQRVIGDLPSVTFTEMLTSQGVLTYNAQTVSRWVYLENQGAESYQANLMSSFVRRAVVLPDIPLVVILDEVRPQNNSAVLWNWFGWTYLRQFDPNIPTGTNLERNQTPFFDFSQTANNLRVRVNGCRAGANYFYFNNPSHIEHVPRMAGVFGVLGDSNFPTLYLCGKVYRPFELNTIYRDPNWDGSDFNVSNPSVANTSSVPHPFAVWTANTSSSGHMNDGVGFVDANQLYRAVFWCAPYRIRSVDGQTLIPNAHANNDWIAHRKETQAEVQVGVFNNAPSAKYGVIVKFKKTGYTEADAVSLEYIPNQSAWDSFIGMQSG